ncbi:TPA: PAS domain-containing protein [Candidatus Poribacteria bacterium]|nr:PAS domain-containing protein [Candidatus Poribacteria bacterium]
MNEKSRRFMDIILDSIADGVFTIDTENRITSFNKAAESITGFSKGEALGQYCFDIFRTNICQNTCALRKTIQTGKPIINHEVNILDKEGRRIPISISTAVLKDDSGNLIGGVETFRDLSQIEALKKELNKQYTFEDIVSKNHKIQQIFSILPDIAESDSTVLIQGPNGSGKELFARAIHNLSSRRDSPYVAVNCGALPDTLLESEFFGYVKGAFTDARADKPGRFARAEGGTLFLDEIGDISPAFAVKLMRVLEEKEYEPLGATKAVKADVRIIAATNKDLQSLVESGAFREDLYYRLNVVKIELPALRERREDIPLLIDHFVDQFNIKMGRNIAGVSDEVLSALMKYDFPGNIRELENIIEYAFVLCKGNFIELEHLPKDLSDTTQNHSKPIARPLEDAEAETIRKILKKHDGNRLKTARELGIDRTTLWRKMKKYGLIGDENRR